MPDYGRDVEFGVFPAPEAAKLGLVFEMAAVADRGGLELVGVQDHPYQRRFVDTFVLMGAILERTRRIRVFPDVANIPLRPPRSWPRRRPLLTCFRVGGSSWVWGQARSGTRSRRWAGRTEQLRTLRWR